MLRVGERGGGMALGMQSRQTGPFILLRLQVLFRAADGRLRCIVFRRAAGGGARGGGGHDCLARVAHFLHRRCRAAAEQTDDTDQNNNEPRHTDAATLAIATKAVKQAPLYNMCFRLT
jgi:hypothetical protein